MFLIVGLVDDRALFMEVMIATYNKHSQVAQCCALFKVLCDSMLLQVRYMY